MKNIYFLTKFLATFIFLSSQSLAVSNSYFDKGKELFSKKKFEESKIFFEKDIVFNPKSENSYLFLAKIFKERDDDLEQEKNLKSVLVINPKNDEAIYMLAVLKIKNSDYDEAKSLIENFDLVCKSFCFKKKEIKDQFNKLTP
tara:strand:- start:5641 stop:6069 length:429 start_codon:yes stop_codon:yes gene_type:complete